MNKLLVIIVAIVIGVSVYRFAFMKVDHYIEDTLETKVIITHTSVSPPKEITFYANQPKIVTYLYRQLDSNGKVLHQEYREITLTYEPGEITSSLVLDKLTSAFLTGKGGPTMLVLKDGRILGGLVMSMDANHLTIRLSISGLE